MTDKTTSRYSRLDTLANDTEQLFGILAVDDHQRPSAIQAAARLALGIAPEKIITDIEETLQQDLLYLMRRFRDSVPSDKRERNDKRYVLHAELVAKSINNFKDEV